MLDQVRLATQRRSISRITVSLFANAMARIGAIWSAVSVGKTPARAASRAVMQLGKLIR